MNEVALSYNEKDLLTFFQQVRLIKAKELSDVNAKGNYSSKDGDSFGQKLSNLSRYLERSFKSADTKKNNANEALEKFNAKNEKVMTKEEVETELSRLFENDAYGLAKLLFGASIILDNEYKYEYLEEGLIEASQILYGNPDTLLQIRGQIEDNYRSLTFGSLSNTEIGLTMCIVGLSLVLAPISALAAVTVGATVGVIAAHQLISNNKEKLKADFKKASSNDNAFYLAMQLTYIQRIRGSIKSEDFKEELDSILKHVEELKADLDYYMFVERDMSKDAKEKSQLFHAFDKRLIKVLELDK